MAEQEQGIHPQVMNHIVDLHRKVSELQLKNHDAQNDEPHAVFQEMLSELKTLNVNLSKLIPAIEADTQTDLKEAGSDKGEAKADKAKVKK